MSTTIAPIRGMNDITPPESAWWQHLENLLANLAISYGYQRISLPIVEKTELFKRSVGNETDIVGKEMYTFEDQNGDSLSLRPEGTAGCVRAGISQNLLFNQTQKLWYLGPMFRHERPQRGRYRQFHQFGLEAFGYDPITIEAELIIICNNLWQSLQLKNQPVLEINYLASKNTRANYIKDLAKFCQANYASLDKDSQTRLNKNPLRILDSKAETTQQVLANAPLLQDYYTDAETTEYQNIKNLLTSMGINFIENPRLVRGLDYYSGLVFEWTTDKLGAQATVCAGGRYDGLVAQLGGKPTGAIGFSLGIERLIELMQIDGATLNQSHPDVFVIALADENSQAALPYSLKLANLLHVNMPDMHIHHSCCYTNLKKQLKKADQLQAKYALIIGDNEAQSKQALLKDLQSGEQHTINEDALSNWLQTNLATEP